MMFERVCMIILKKCGGGQVKMPGIFEPVALQTIIRIDKELNLSRPADN